MKAQEAAYLAAYVPPEPNKRVEPYMGVPASRLFSHGTNQNARFLASMTSLHFTEPSSREYGAKSHDRVHRSYFWGSKHIDSMVPQNDPNTRQLLTTAKRAQWEVEQAPAVPVAPSCYITESQKSWVNHRAQPMKSSFARKFAL